MPIASLDPFCTRCPQCGGELMGELRALFSPSKGYQTTANTDCPHCHTPLECTAVWSVVYTQAKVRQSIPTSGDYPWAPSARQEWETIAQDKDLPPAIWHYAECKLLQPQGSLMLYRVGDFYEALGQDAVNMADALGLKLLSKRMDVEGRSVSLCGFPAHASARYIPYLLGAGHWVRVIDYDPATVKEGTPWHMIPRKTEEWLP